MWIIILLFGITLMVALLIKNVQEPDEETNLVDLNTFDITFSPHALKRIKEREIDPEEVVKLLKDKNAHAEIETGGRIKVTNGDLTVIITKSGTSLYVLTVFWEEKK
ncbi:MAG: hypothetical protein PWQ27_1612 [Kosmotoga sp.]|nr:hypothetical protein [Kosmotoga sp.]